MQAIQTDDYSVSLRFNKKNMILSVIFSSILLSVLTDAKFTPCNPTDVALDPGKEGVCASSTDLGKLCAESNMEVSSSKDCSAFDGSWCCYHPVLNKKVVAEPKIADEVKSNKIDSRISSDLKNHNRDRGYQRDHDNDRKDHNYPSYQNYQNYRRGEDRDRDDGYHKEKDHDRDDRDDGYHREKAHDRDDRDDGYHREKDYDRDDRDGKREYDREEKRDRGYGIRYEDDRDDDDRDVYRRRHHDSDRRDDRDRDDDYQRDRERDHDRERSHHNRRRHYSESYTTKKYQKPTPFAVKPYPVLLHNAYNSSYHSEKGSYASEYSTTPYPPVKYYPVNTYKLSYQQNEDKKESSTESYATTTKYPMVTEYSDLPSYPNSGSYEKATTTATTTKGYIYKPINQNHDHDSYEKATTENYSDEIDEDDDDDRDSYDKPAKKHSDKSGYRDRDRDDYEKVTRKRHSDDSYKSSHQDRNRDSYAKSTTKKYIDSYTASSSSTTKKAQPQYPGMAINQSSTATNDSQAYYSAGEPFASDWDREHRSRHVYDKDVHDWVKSNLKVAWDAAVSMVEGQNDKYSKKAQCGYVGNPYDSMETRNQKRGEILTVMAQWLWDNYPYSNKERLHKAMLNVNPYDHDFLSECLGENYDSRKANCGEYQKYSRPDQICNNWDYPTWGAYDDIGVRITDIWNYDGGIWLKMRNHIWPNYDGTYAQLMNEKQLANLLDKSNDACYNLDATMIHAYFAQFITHDIIKSAPYTVTDPYGEQIKPQCCGIDNDCLHHSCHPVTSRVGGVDNYAASCMQYSDNVPGIDYCLPQAKDNRNLQTAYIDGSAIYGATCERAAQLRSFQNGKLKVNKGYYGLYSKNINLPDDPHPDRDECDTTYQTGELKCFMAGDKRANQHPGLTAWHTVWLRFHNRLAASCSKRLDRNYLAEEELDEICYQETRRYVQAILQNIFYRDHIPVQLGAYVAGNLAYSLNLDVVVPYNPYVHASVWPEYTYAAGRLHTVISHWAQIQDPARVAIGWQEPQSWYSINDFLFKGYGLAYSKNNVKELFTNSLYDPEQCFDTSFVAELRAGMGTSAYNPGGLDMLSVNLAREREFGIPWYTQLREFCGMSPVYEWYHLQGIFSQHCLDTLPGVYGHVKNIEGYVGMLCEIPLPGALVGPTTACILQRQYQNLREGDRYFFDRNGMTGDQMKVIKKINLGKVLCMTANLDYVTENVFRTPNEKTNKYVPCKEYGDVTEDDLSSLWTTIPAYGGDYRTCKDYGAAYGLGYGAAFYQNNTYVSPEGRDLEEEDIL